MASIKSVLGRLSPRGKIALGGAGLAILILVFVLFLVFGGTAIYAKIAAARTLGLRVLMIARPDKAVGHPVQSEQEAVAWLLHDALRSPRGV